jgi:uncharacterized delta-60 repeat protein
MQDSSRALSALLVVASMIIFTGCLSGQQSNPVSPTQPGSLDTSFNPPQGWVMSTFAENNKDRGIEVAIQKDGKIVVLGYSNNSKNEDLLLTRYTHDGVPDWSFGIGGIVLYDGGGNDKGLGLEIQTDGKILATGFTYNGSHRDVLLLRYNMDGMLDSTFGNNGVVTFSSPGSSTDIGFAVTCEEDGGIMVAGEVSNKTHQDVLVLHYTPEGVLDSRFADGGVYMYGGTGMDRGFDATVQRDKKILITGATIINQKDDVLLLRLNPDGTRDQTFGKGGVVRYSADGDKSDYGNYISAQGDGTIIVSGAASVGDAFELLLLRYDANGTPDLLFGDGGAVHHGNPAGRDEYGYAHVVQPDGKIIVVGYTTDRITDDLLVMRFDNTGDVDPGFAMKGHLIWNGPGNVTDYGQGIALQSDGMIIVTGFTHHGESEDLLLMRILP